MTELDSRPCPVPEDAIRRFTFTAGLADAVKSRRKELGMTQDDLAVSSGIDRVTISRIESCRQLAAAGTMLRLLDALALEIQFVPKGPPKA